MTRQAFDRLHPGSDIEMDDKVYRVLGIDHMGRIHMQQVTYYFWAIGCIVSDDYDTYEEAADALKDMIDEADDNDEAEALSEADIEEHVNGKKFWMHYKDINS